MGFQFAETLAGTIEWDATPGARHPFRLELTARAPSVRQHLADGKAALTGVLHAPPVAAGVPVEGTLTLRPLGQRFVRYELAFVGEDGKPYELVGQKDVSWRAPLQTLTTLPAEILDDEHRRVATCQGTSTVPDLWACVRSLRPSKG